MAPTSKSHNIEYKAVVTPLSGSQSLALSCPADEILYEGTRGPGKTACQLMRFFRLVGRGYGAFWRGVIFDMEYKDLQDIINQSKKLFGLFNNGARFLRSPSELKWIWPTGEELLFRYAKTADDYWGFHGQEFPFIGYNELTKRPDPDFYLEMFSCMRSSFRPQDYPLEDGSLLPPIPLECFSTTNPFGVGHSWVKKRFIDPVPRGVINREIEILVNPQTQLEEPIELKRVALHGSWKENPYLDPKYIARLKKIKDPNKRRAWLFGDWSITSGGRFDHLWREQVHCVKPFVIPRGWTVDRAYDHGESSPFAVLWFAESDGNLCEIDGKTYKYPRGTIFVIGEYYGGEPEEHNKGINLASSKIAKNIIKIEKGLLHGQRDDVEQGEVNYIANICKNHLKIDKGPADSSIWTGQDGEKSIYQKMRGEGVDWDKCKKGPNSRVNGAAELCEMLESALDAIDTESKLPQKPALYFFNNCRGIISRFPVLSRDKKIPEDIDTKQEDHDYDALRYRVMTKRFVSAVGIKAG